MRFLQLLRDEQSRNQTLRIIVLLWSVILYAAFQPGLMSSDTIDQYTQGLSGVYNDIHPPLGSWLLGVSGRLAGSPWLILVAQLLAMGTAMAFLVRSTDPRKGQWGVLVMVAFVTVPTVWALAVVLWKDVMTAAAMLGAVAALKSRRPLLALALLLAGVAFRHNALIAAVPLSLPVIAQLSPRSWRWPLKGLALGATVVALTISPSVVNRALNASKGWAAGQLFLFDLAGIYTVHPELIQDSLLAPQTSAGELAITYTPSHVWPLFGGAEGARPITFDALAARRTEFIDEWLRVVRAHPVAWMSHRVASFQQLMGAVSGPVPFPILQDIDANPFHLRSPREGWLNQLARKIENRVGQTFLFRGWAWMLFLGALTLMALRSIRRKPLAFCTAVSGFAYSMSYLFIGIGSDFRFIYWSVIATFATLALLVTEELPVGPESSPGPR